MSYDDEDWVDPSWLGDVKSEIIPGMVLDPDVAKSWGVILNFKKDGAPGVGNGFFLSIPDIPSYHVIFTAAHNLVNKAGVRTTDLSASYDPSPSVTPRITKVVADGDVYVCEGYAKTGAPADDYGFIRIKREGESRRGFGYSIKLAYEVYFKDKIYVTGFEPSNLAFNLTAGPCMECYKKVVVYDAKTQQGISGSAVWIDYMNSQVAIAIHNTGNTGSGSRGARLTAEVFRNAFDWLTPSVIQKNIQLRAWAPPGRKAPPKLPVKGLFLSFEGGMGFGRVRLGSGTKFDLMPSQAVRVNKDQYTDHLSLATADGWLTFDCDSPRATKITQEMNNGCLFKFMQKKVVVEQNGKSYEMRMEGTYIKEDEEGCESSEVYFQNYPGAASAVFNKFDFV